MTLVFILIALGVDHLLGNHIERWRRLAWFIRLYHKTEGRLPQYCDGNIGVIVFLFFPVAMSSVILFLLGQWSWWAETVVALLLLIYCLSPKHVVQHLDEHIGLADWQGEQSTVVLTDEADIEADVMEGDIKVAIETCLIQAHKRLFAIIFWFLVLGVLGALLYKLVDALNDELQHKNNGFANSVHHLLNILEWPSSRSMAIGLALAGSLVPTFAGWRKAERFSFSVNDSVLVMSGTGALHYLPALHVNNAKSYWCRELKGLLYRSVILWLALLAMMILSGVLH